MTCRSATADLWGPRAGPAEPCTDRSCLVGGAASTVDGVDHRKEVRNFLVRRRARPTPEQAGPPGYGGTSGVAGMTSIPAYARNPFSPLVVGAENPVLAPAAVGGPGSTEEPLDVGPGVTTRSYQLGRCTITHVHDDAGSAGHVGPLVSSRLWASPLPAERRSRHQLIGRERRGSWRLPAVLGHGPQQRRRVRTRCSSGYAPEPVDCRGTCSPP